MPGIGGFVNTDLTTQQRDDRVHQIEASLLHEPAWESRNWSDQAACTLLAVGRDHHAVERQIVSQGATTIVLEGELYGQPTDLSHAEYFLREYRSRGTEFLSDVEGRFVAALWCGDTRRLTLLTDKFASKPLYYRVGSDAIAFSTSIRAIAAQADSQDLNRDGVIQFFTFGHLWNNDTFYTSIKSMGPAECLVYDVESQESTRTQYWRPSVVSRDANLAENQRRISLALKQAVDAQTLSAEGLGLALSGGLDARTILGLVDTNRVRPHCVSLGMEGSLDQRSARRLAELAGCQYRQFVLGAGFLERFEEHLHRMVALTDGHYLSQCIVMPTLPLYQELGVGVLLRGHVGELMHMQKAYNFSVDASFANVRDSQSLETWLWSRLQSHLTQGVDRPLLAGVSTEEFAELGRRSLRLSLADTEHWEHPLDRISQLFLDQRTRRETAMSLVKFNSVVEVRVPYLDSRVINAVFAAPPELRVGETIQTELLRQYRPEFLKPANSNTGAPVGANRFWREFCYYRMRVLAKLGVKGYQPYERLGLWLRQELRPVVEKILLDSRCLDRGLFDADCVRTVVRRHGQAERNHTFLIMAMLTLEIGLRAAGREVVENQPIGK